MPLCDHSLGLRAAHSYVQAAQVGLQDTAPRDALLGLHARVEARAGYVFGCCRIPPLPGHVPSVQ